MEPGASPHREPQLRKVPRNGRAIGGQQNCSLAHPMRERRMFDGDAPHAAKEWRLVTQTGGSPAKAELPQPNC